MITLQLARSTITLEDLDMFNKFMEMMMNKMCSGDKEKMMNEMMGKFCDNMSPEDRKKMMETMMPKMMQGINMMELMPGMMMKMMGNQDSCCGDKADSKMSMMPEMAQKMMPVCLEFILPKISIEKRERFILKLISVINDNGMNDLDAKKKKDFLKEINKILK
jgi:hypothetical protein